MADRINIHPHVAAICEQLGLEPNLVMEMTITPRHVTAVVCRTNDEGSKYVEDNGEVAVDNVEYEVTA